MTTTLITEIASSNVDLDERVTRHLENGLARLDTWTRGFPQRSCRVHVELRPRDQVHSVRLQLELPSKTIHAEDEARHLLAAVERVFKKALRQLRDFKSLLRRDHMHRRMREIREQVPEISEAEVTASARRQDRERFREMAQDHANRVRSFLKRELAALRGARRLQRGVDDLVEETLVEAFERFDEKPIALETGRWLYSVALEILERHAARPAEDTVGIVEDALPVPPPPSLEDDLYDGLHRLLFHGEVEDDDRTAPAPNGGTVMGTSMPDPGDAVAAAEIEEIARELLGSLPSTWRRAFLLHVVEGFDVQEISQIQGMSEEQVLFNVHSAELFLREHFTERAR